jgi:hypothetical protein
MWPFTKKEKEVVVLPSYTFDSKPRYRVVPEKSNSFCVEKLGFDGRWVLATELPTVKELAYYSSYYPVPVIRKTAREAEEYIKEALLKEEEYQKRQRKEEEFKKLNPPYEVPPYREL